MKCYSLILVVLVAAIASVAGFSVVTTTGTLPSAGTKRCTIPPQRPTHVALSAMGGVRTLDNNDDLSYRTLLIKARECAFSDESNAVDAKKFLNGILELESACASGTVSDREVCQDNVLELAEIVSHLRQKVELNPTTTTNNKILHPVNIIAGMSEGTFFTVFVVLAYLAEYQWDSESVPFTFQEWMWAAKGGYLHTMIAHFVRNGGL